MADNKPPITVVSVSDMHGLYLRHCIDVPQGDVLVIAGDIELRHKQDVALLEGWLASLPHPHKVVGFGNMDRAAFEAGESLSIAGATVVVDKVVEVGGLRLLASPWSPEYAGVWQIESEAEGKAHWARLLPHDLELDVLVTHTPPAGYGDLTRGSHVGDKQLLAAVQHVQPTTTRWSRMRAGAAAAASAVGVRPHPRGGGGVPRAAPRSAGGHSSCKRRGVLHIQARLGGEGSAAGGGAAAGASGGAGRSRAGGGGGSIGEVARQ